MCVWVGLWSAAKQHGGKGQALFHRVVVLMWWLWGSRTICYEGPMPYLLCDANVGYGVVPSVLEIIAEWKGIGYYPVQIPP